MRRLTAREQRTILALSVSVVISAWVYSRYVVGPMWRRANGLSQELTSAKEQLRTLKTATLNESAVAQQHRQLQEAVETMQGLLPSEEELSAVIELLSGLASQSSVRIQAIFPQRQPEEAGLGHGENGLSGQDSVYRAIPIQIDALAGYHQLGTFLSLVETGNKPTRIANLRIMTQSKEPRRHLIKLIIEAYFAPSKHATASRSARKVALAQ